MKEIKIQKCIHGSKLAAAEALTRQLARKERGLYCQILVKRN